jgi:adenosyl cobinamide kinase/adenosyl cobinamide phosphate guanylyltransferase
MAIKYLKIRTGADKTKEGNPRSTPLVVVKNKAFGNTISEKAIKKTQHILITGAHNSGKSKWVARLHDKAKQIWIRYPSPPIYLHALEPLLQWVDQPQVKQWWDKQRNKETTWKQLKQHQRATALETYLQKNKAVLFIDDAHKLTGRKLQIATKCLSAAKIFIVAASTENKIAPSLRSIILRAKPQTYNLKTKTAYDATSILMWCGIGFCLIAGWMEFAIVLGALKLLSTGRLAAKQE